MSTQAMIWIWIRRGLALVLVAILSIMVYGAIVIIDTGMRAVIVGGGSCLVPPYVWLDRQLTGKIRLYILATRLESSGG